MHKQLKLYLVDTFANYSFFVPIVSALIYYGSGSVEAVIAYAVGSIPLALGASRVYSTYLLYLRKKLSPT